MLIVKATLRSHFEAVSARLVNMSGVATRMPLRMLIVTASEELAPRTGCKSLTMFMERGSHCLEPER